MDLAQIMLSVLSGIFGAFLVFVLGVVRQELLDDREGVGLLRLLRSEIEHNAEVVTTIQDSGRTLATSPNLRSMKAETWRAVRGRAAQVLPKELTALLDGYYSPLDIALSLVAFQGMQEEQAERMFRAAVARGRREEIPRSRDPFTEYVLRTLTAQDQARSGIDEYLARSRWSRWWRRWFGDKQLEERLRESRHPWWRGAVRP